MTRFMTASNLRIEDVLGGDWMTLFSVGILGCTAILAALSIAGGLWNLVDAIALVLHRAAVRGRARSAGMQARLERRWIENVSSGMDDEEFPSTNAQLRTRTSIEYGPACSARLE